MCVACQLISISFDSLTNISQQFGLCKHFQQKLSHFMLIYIHSK